LQNTAKITVSTLGEADFFAAHGFQDILYAVPIIKHKLQRALDLTRQVKSRNIYHSIINLRNEDKKILGISRFTERCKSSH